MASNKLFCILLVLAFGIVLMGANPKVEARALYPIKPCPAICYLELHYMTCPESGDQHLRPACNCCEAPGCTIHFTTGDHVDCPPDAYNFY